MSRILDVYLKGSYTGQLEQKKDGSLSFSYDPAYIAGQNLAISLSLPLRLEAYEGSVVKAFFSGILPDEDVRYRLAKYLGVSEKNPFALLEEVGGECAGALSLYPQGIIPQKPSKHDMEVLDDQKIRELLDHLKQRPLLIGDDGLRLSLAGAQDKIAVGMHEGRIALVRGESPTTHILKPMISSIKDSVYNEFFCMQLARLVGIDTPPVHIGDLGDISYFLVERYDRITDENGQTIRLHQEDFCQALGIMPELKYEREGGPSLLQCQTTLGRFSNRPAIDSMKFLERVIFNYLIGNADAHGKNFSFLYKDVKPELAPAYDLMSTAVYPSLSKRMAMKIGGKYNPEDVFLRHWYSLVSDTEIAKKKLEQQLKEFSTLCLEKAHELKDTLKLGGIESPIFGDILMVIESRLKPIR